MERIKRRAEELWEDDADMLNDMIDDEIEAYQELHAMEIENVPNSMLEELKHAAEREHPADYSEQRDYVTNGVKSYLYVQGLREKIEPIRELLIKMERIIGSECYNANIQNYGPRGVWEDEGCSFRYPITFIVNDEDDRHRTVPSNTNPEVLMTGRYKFGANELSIFRALEKVVEMLQDDYGLQLPERK